MYVVFRTYLRMYTVTVILIIQLILQHLNENVCEYETI